MADPAEQSFLKTFLSTISSQPITFPDDHQQPPQEWLKKVTVLPIPVPALPAREVPDAAPASSSARISVTFKSLKPPASYTLSVHPTDTILSIKEQLASDPTAPPSDAQRLLLKGKALVDSKLLQEYSVKDEDIIFLLLKSGFEWDPAKPTTVSKTTTEGEGAETSLSSTPQPMDVDEKKPTGLGGAAPQGGRRGHQRIPSVVLSPSPSSESPGVVEKDIILTLDGGDDHIAPEVQSTFSITISKPEFWRGLFTFLKSEFKDEGDAMTAFENFFRASKGAMSVSQIAKIRGQVGIVGMAGT